ncbi:MAG TPA: hypothetical protein VHR66_18005 [Gemmataceae bacterium]|jgi:hypothetical protein|nr:hypothetical protein [Gemmataceae bacterium]
MAHIVSIAFTPRDVERRPTDYYARVPVERATLVEQRGIKGDVKGAGGARQLNVMRAEVLSELAAEGRKVEAGQMGEQLVIAGLDADALVEGMQLQHGNTVVIEIGIPRTGGNRFEYTQGVTRQAWPVGLASWRAWRSAGRLRLGMTSRLFRGPSLP